MPPRTFRTGRSAAPMPMPILPTKPPKRPRPPFSAPWYTDGGVFTLPDPDFAANRRTVTSLLKSSGNGDLPNLFADTLNDKKFRGKAEPEFGDFLNQLHQRDPERAGEFERDVMKKMTREGAQNLKSFIQKQRGSAQSATRPSSRLSTPHPAGRRATPEGMAKARVAAKSISQGGHDASPTRAELMRRMVENMTERNEADNKKPASLLALRNHPRDSQNAIKDAIPPAPRKPPLPVKWETTIESRPFFDSGKETYKVNGPIKIERWSDTLGGEGINFDVNWYALDKNGARDLSIESVTQPGGGYSGATGLMKGLFDFVPKEMHEPPFNHPYGWEVEVDIPPQPIRNGNSTGTYLRVYVPEGQSKWRNRKKN